MLHHHLDPVRPVRIDHENDAIERKQSVQSRIKFWFHHSRVSYHKMITLAREFRARVSFSSCASPRKASRYWISAASRPGPVAVTADEELSCVVPVIAGLHDRVATPISINIGLDDEKR